MQEIELSISTKQEITENKKQIEKVIHQLKDINKRMIKALEIVKSSKIITMSKLLQVEIANQNEIKDIVQYLEETKENLPQNTQMIIQKLERANVLIKNLQSKLDSEMDDIKNQTLEKYSKPLEQKLEQKLGLNILIKLGHVKTRLANNRINKSIEETITTQTAIFNKTNKEKEKEIEIEKRRVQTKAYPTQNEVKSQNTNIEEAKVARPMSKEKIAASIGGGALLGALAGASLVGSYVLVISPIFALPAIGQILGLGALGLIAAGAIIGAAVGGIKGAITAIKQDQNKKTEAPKTEVPPQPTSFFNNFLTNKPEDRLAPAPSC